MDVLNHGELKNLEVGPRTAKSIDWKFDTAENVKVLISNLVRLYRARFELIAMNMTGLGLMRLTNN